MAKWNIPAAPAFVPGDDAISLADELLHDLAGAGGPVADVQWLKWFIDLWELVEAREAAR